MKPTFLAHLTLLCLAGAISAPAAELWPVPEWQVVAEDARSLKASAREELNAFAQEQNSRALLIVRGGKIESESYFLGWKADQPHGAGSAAKAFTSALVGIAIAEGKIPAVTTPVATWLPDSRIARATLADLLTMRSGLPYDNALQQAMHRSDDWLAFIGGQTPVRGPGVQFHYSGFDPILIAAILKKATGTALNDYAEERLFGPLGIRGARWEGDKQGLTNGGSMLAMTARDYARFGLLFLRQGRWQERVVVPADWVKQSTPNQFEKGWPWYGYYWWRLPWKTESSDPRLLGCYFASGGGGQHIILLPALDTVIVRLGDEPKLTPSGQKFVPELLNRFLSCLP